MIDPVKQLIGIVIKKDGLVPFDDDVPEENRNHMIAHLVGKGHHLQPVEGTRHMRIMNWGPGA
jgi:hypothetical protein